MLLNNSFLFDKKAISQKGEKAPVFSGFCTLFLQMPSKVIKNFMQTHK